MLIIDTEKKKNNKKSFIHERVKIHFSKVKLKTLIRDSLISIFQVLKD